MKMNILAKFKNRKKHKVILRLASNNKKFSVLRFNDEEFDLIKKAAQIENVTIQQFFQNIIKDLPSQQANKIKKHEI